MVQILDTTLREGEQTPGVYFDPHIKMAIAKLLDEIGVDIIEAGHPMVTEEIHTTVRKIASAGLNASVGAHARSLKKDVDLALECGVDFIGVFYCVSENRLNSVFNKDLNAAIDQITEVIAYARDQKPDLIIRYTPEDTVRSPWDNVIKASVAAVRAGADIISVADTTGYMIPGTERSLYHFVKKLKKEFSTCGLSPKVAVHCHNDRGLALANALDGYHGGADIIDATVLGLGERAGLVDLASLLTIMKFDFQEKNNWRLEKLTTLYELVSQHSKIPIPVNFPMTGRNAFSHCAGVHTQAALIDPVHYESLHPRILGRKTQIALDHMSGLNSVKYALNEIGETHVPENLMLRILNRVKQVGKRGRVVDLDELKHITDWCRHHEED